MKRQVSGVVTSTQADKTVVITASLRKTHPLYGKQYTVSRKFMAHDAKNDAQVGDEVLIVEDRPRSARKRFKLLKIVKRRELGYEEADATADVPTSEEKPG